MRIIAGKYKSRKLKTLSGDQTRPTLDHVKESFFNRVGPFFDGGNVLDVFGGSGAIAIEFLSRGAQSASIIENNKQAIAVIKENIKLVEEEVELYPMSYQKALIRLNYTFDYIYCDPPYQFKEIDKLFSLLRNVSDTKTLIFYEADKKEDIQTPEGFTCLRVDDYKRTKILWFQPSNG